MPKEWIKGVEGRNLKFKRERLLNDAMNRWGLNKAFSVGPTSHLIRQCSPRSFEEWERYYFKNAKQKKRNGIRISKGYLTEIGRKLYIKLSEVIQSEIESITEEECIDYVYNLVLNRTYDGYQSEIQTIYGQLEQALGVKVEPAPDKWDRGYNIDFFIKIKDKYIGLQIKPAGYAYITQIINELKFQQKTHEKFTAKYGGRVFYIISVKEGKKKIIYNPEIIEEIRKEIERLKNE
ncbi:MjaI family restriction endonuclease [candidate division WOR-3 bacterium JGI_Cruoil_03_44_89]|uniref:MjaI family restriction endonuclease n=1 Tax=candidate division WOR-3 bacterium JGI_Cruoil_03_44_89 TaxID=1973748 RepID=A0A235BS31_UNCW3|nr:MAG: MjaI family restriction endonuclease [candidate division WOR-3 bacterium JGI_Cruoil_03_44_89]